MRVGSVSGYHFQNNVSRVVANKNQICRPKLNENPADTIEFKGFGGKVAGGLIGAGIAGLTTLAVISTGGLAAAGVLLLAETGGAVAGGALGDKITGKDDDDSKNENKKP